MHPSCFAHFLRYQALQVFAQYSVVPSRCLFLLILRRTFCRSPTWLQSVKMFPFQFYWLVPFPLTGQSEAVFTETHRHPSVLTALGKECHVSFELILLGVSLLRYSQTTPNFLSTLTPYLHWFYTAQPPWDLLVTGKPCYFLVNLPLNGIFFVQSACAVQNPRVFLRSPSSMMLLFHVFLILSDLVSKFLLASHQPFHYQIH